MCTSSPVTTVITCVHMYTSLGPNIVPPSMCHIYHDDTSLGPNCCTLSVTSYASSEAPHRVAGSAPTAHINSP